MLAIFGAASLAAVAVGAVVCAFADVPRALWLRNLAGWAVGAGAALAIAAAYRPVFLTVALWLAPLGLLAAFLGPNQLGVHRWIPVGPLTMNAAMMLLPSAVVALAVLEKGRLAPWLAGFAALAVLAAQPDASQATASTAAMIGIAAISSRKPLVRLGLVTAAGGLAAVAWLRPDPLAPAPEVEGILGLAMELSPLFAGMAVLSLAAASAAPLAAGARQIPAVALSLCLLASAVTPFLGAFPVPLVGVGLSPILGAWLGVGLLAGLVRRSA